MVIKWSDGTEMRATTTCRELAEPTPINPPEQLTKERVDTQAG